MQYHLSRNGFIELLNYVYVYYIIPSAIYKYISYRPRLLLLLLKASIYEYYTTKSKNMQ